MFGRFFIFVFCLFGVTVAYSQDWPKERDTSCLPGKIIFEQYCDSFPEIYMMPEWYKLQLIYVQVNRNKNGIPHLTYHKLGVDRNKYFYPASLVKLPTLLLTLEKLQSLKSRGVDKYTRLSIGKEHSCQYEFKTDTSGIEDYPCIANFIRRILLVSDNWSYNRLFEFVGQKELNEGLRRKGYT
ncbi:MAG TPA: serine hydrolase, partial [Bacteroidales bacterium]|nr:serine hydrolase [Bacteroidales bacterium]